MVLAVFPNLNDSMKTKNSYGGHGRSSALLSHAWGTAEGENKRAKTCCSGVLTPSHCLAEADQHPVAQVWCGNGVHKATKSKRWPSMSSTLPTAVGKGWRGLGVSHIFARLQKIPSQCSPDSFLNDSCTNTGSWDA